MNVVYDNDPLNFHLRIRPPKNVAQLGFMNILPRPELFAAGYAKEYHIWDRIDIELIKHLSGYEKKPTKIKSNFIFQIFFRF